jgi:hypothetical protein
MKYAILGINHALLRGGLRRLNRLYGIEHENRFATRSIFLQRKAARSALAVKGFTSAKAAPLTGCGPI